MKMRPRKVAPVPAVEPLERRELLSLAAKLPSLDFRDTSSAFFADLHVAATVHRAPVEITFGDAWSVPLASVDVVFGSGKVIGVDSQEGTTASYQAADGHRGYTLVPVVDWGDGFTTTGAPSVRAQRPNPSHADFTGSHPYAQEGLYHVRFQLFAEPEQGGPRRRLAQSKLEVRVNPSQATVPGAQVFHPTATVNVLQELHLASIYHPTFDQASEPVLGEIFWWDGTTTAARVARNAFGEIEIFGTHRYTQTGTFPVTVGLRQQTRNGMLYYRPWPTTVTVVAIGERLTARVGAPFLATLGSIARPAEFPPTAMPVTYRISTADDVLIATIHWGDGEESPGMFVSNASDGYDLAGAHTYARSGRHVVRVEVYRGVRLGGAHHTSPYAYTLDQTLFATVLAKRNAQGFGKLPPRGEF